MHLFSNRSQRMSKCGKNISDTLRCTSRATFCSCHILTSSVIYYRTVTHSAAPLVPLFCSYHILTSSVIYYTTVTHLATPHVPIFLFLPHFDVIYDLFLNRCLATWNLFVKFAILYIKLSISRSSEIF